MAVDIEELIERGVAYANNSQYDAARSDFEAALSLDPERFELFSNLGTLSQLANEHEVATQHYSQALLLQPNHIASLYSRGLSFASLGQYDKAYSDYSLVLSHDPHFVRAFMGRGHVLMQQGKWKEALVDFEQFLSHSASQESGLVEQVETWRGSVLHVLEPQTAVSQSDEDIQSQAEQALQAGDLALAASLAELSLSRAPETSAAHNLYSCVMVAYENWRQAKAHIDMAIAYDPDSPILRLNRAIIFHALNQIEDAEVDLRKAIELDPTHPEAQLELGSLLSASQPKVAMDAFSAAIELDPELVEARLGRGRIYLLRQQPGLALLDLVHAQEVAPNHPDVYQLFQEVMQVFADEIQKHPRDAMPYVRRAQAFMQLGRDQDAMADWNYALKLDPDNPHLFNGRAVLFLELEHYHQAILDLEQAMMLAPEQADLYFHRAMAYIHLMRTPEAIADVTEAITLAPEKPNAWFVRGKLMRTQGQLEGAAMDLKQALDLGGDEADIYREYALVLLEQGNIEGAVKAYQQAVERFPHPDLLLDCAYTLQAIDKLDEALPYLNQLLDDWPDHTEGLTERGWLLAQLGQLDEGLADLDQAVALMPHLTEPLYYRAEIYASQQNWDALVMDASRCLMDDAQHVRMLYLRGLAYHALEQKAAAERDWQWVVYVAPESEEARLVRESQP